MTQVFQSSVLREYFHSTKATFFKHGDVYFGSDGMSIGLVYRTTVHKKEVWDATGMLVVDPNETLPNNVKSHHKHCNNILNSYIADKHKKGKEDKKIQRLYIRLKEQYLS